MNHYETLDEALLLLNESDKDPYDVFMNKIKSELDKGCKELRKFISDKYKDNDSVKILKYEKNLCQKGYQFYYKSFSSIHIQSKDEGKIISELKAFFNSIKLENISYKIRKSKFKSLDKLEKIAIEIDIYLDEKYSDNIQKEIFK